MLTRSIFALCFLITITINIVTLKDGHNWGGDFSQYIINAQNIIAGREFNSGVMLENPFNYPPGLALVLSPVIKIFGVNFVVLKFLNVLFWYSTIFLFYKIALRQLDKSLAQLCCLLLAVSSGFFTYKQNVLSDIPFAFFITLAVYFFTEYGCPSGPASRGRQLDFFVFLAVTAFATLIRSAGVILFAAAFVYLGFIKKDWKKAGWVIVFWGVTWGTQILFCGIQPGFFNQIIQNPAQFISIAFARGSIPFRTVLWFFCPGQTVLTEGIFNLFDKLLIFLTPFLYLAIIWIFVRGLREGKSTLTGFFLFLYLWLMLLWSGFLNDPKALGRLAWPIAGFVLIYGVSLLKKKEVAKTVLSVLIVLNIFNIAGIFNFNDDVLLRKENQELFQWVRENIGEDEHYMSWQARPLALMTGRVGALPYNPQIREDFPVRVARLNITYLIMLRGAGPHAVDEPLIQMLQNSPQYAALVWENPDYQIFKIIKGTQDLIR